MSNADGTSGNRRAGELAIRRQALRGAAALAAGALGLVLDLGSGGLPLAYAEGDEAGADATGDTAGVTGVAPEQPAAPAPEAAAPPPEVGPLELQMLALVNGARAARGMAPLEWDSVIAIVARAHAGDMMRRGVVSHTGSDGSTPVQRMRRAGVQFRFGSENIWTYWGKVPELGPATMHAAMMAEPFAPGLWNHIGNILYTGYRRIGIGIVTAPSGVQYLSEKFAD
jgi:uncharacterized protein YkwD